MDCMLLERRSKWRLAALGCLLGAAALPALPLVLAALEGATGAGNGGAAPGWWNGLAGPRFAGALGSSGALAACTALFTFALGWPSGVAASLHAVPGRRFLLPLAALPLFAPSFLWALGWSELLARLGPAATRAFSGLAGPVLVFTGSTAALPLLAAHAAASSFGGPEVDAARLSGGERALFLLALRRAAPAALLAALLAGVLALSDPGPGQIFELRTAGSEILASFAAQFDEALAARQCLLLAAVALLFALPVAALGAPRLSAGVLARQVGRPRLLPARGPAVRVAALLLAITAAGAVLPLAGLALPVAGGADAARAATVVGRTALDTLLYAGGAAALAVLLGFAAALCAGRGGKAAVLALGASVALFSAPPALAALGATRLARSAPAWCDPVLRGRGMVCAILGLRFFPVAFVLGLRALRGLPRTWTLAAALHGAPLALYLRRVIFPAVRRDAAAALLLVAVLAAGDVTTVQLLEPAGHESLALAISTVLANARERFVASLCLAYAGLAAAGLVGLRRLAAGREGRG